MRLLLIYITLGFLVIGGCQNEKKPAEPSTAALKDDFTKSYLTSSKEVEKGYYRFKSKTGGYTMLLPVQAVISKDFGNERDEDFYEAIIYGAEIDQADVDTQIIYENKPLTAHIEENLDLLSSSSGYDGPYSESESKEIILYKGEETDKTDDYLTYIYVGYIKAKKTNQAVHFIYGATCKKEETACQNKEENHKDSAMKIMNSFTFSE
ncbi:hypothetical protein [Metabacillus sp. FJAT-52054]|uniref:Lipoprotein YvcA n=1 Tax=Metabacillus sediminis TaxID=3117746 RepID=A0ABZ2NFX8_9BACI